MFGRDCSEIETNPKADPFDKEICRTFRQFEKSFGDFTHDPVPEELQDDQNTPQDDDPESLRSSILSRPDYHDAPDKPRKHSWKHPKSHTDENLDEQVARDPSFLDRYLDKPQKPHTRVQKPHTRVYSSHSSVSISTIRRPDGSVEQRKTIKDSDGNETVTITKIQPDGTDLESEETFLKPEYSREERDTNRKEEGTNTYFGRLSDWLWSR